MGKTGKAEIYFSVFWVALGLYVAMVSYSLCLGSFQTPGCGFMPFFFGLFLMGFAVFDVAIGILKSRAKNNSSLKSYPTGIYVRLGILIACLVAYGLFVERVGFVITTSVVLFCLFRVAGCGWVISVIWGPVVATLSYFVFTYLGVLLPAGLLRI
jgi:hypothetical protein